MKTAVLAPEVLAALHAEGYTEDHAPNTSPLTPFLTSFVFSRPSACYAGERNTLFIVQQDTETTRDGSFLLFTSAPHGSLGHHIFDHVLTLDVLQAALDTKQGSVTVREAMAM